MLISLEMITLGLVSIQRALFVIQQSERNKKVSKKGGRRMSWRPDASAPLWHLAKGEENEIFFLIWNSNI